MADPLSPPSLDEVDFPVGESERSLIANSVVLVDGCTLGVHSAGRPAPQLSSHIFIRQAMQAQQLLELMRCPGSCHQLCLSAAASY